MDGGSPGTIAARSAVGGPVGLVPGALVGGRFEVQGPWGPASVGETHRAVDKKTGKGIAIRVLPAASFQAGAGIEQLRASVKLAATLTHKNIVSTFGMGVESSGVVFVATELVDGRTLRAVMDDRRSTGAMFSVRSAYNVIAHICNAVGYAHGKLTHGALCPTAVLVSRAGRVKVGDFGLLGAVSGTERSRLLAATGQQAYVAPETLGATGQPGQPADLYAIGVLLFELLVGRAPGAGEKLASLGTFAPALAQFVDRAMATAPGQRFGSAVELKGTLHELVSSLGDDDHAAAPAEEGIDIEVDVEPTGEHRTPLPKVRGGFTAPAEVQPAPAPAPRVAAAVPDAPRPARPAAPVAPAASVPLPPPPGPARAPTAEPVPRVGARVAVDAEFRPSLAPASPEPDRASVVDLGALLSELTASDAERWMVQKDKLDHGPFSARELVQQIMRGDVLSDHVVVNMDTGERKKLKAWPEFKGFAEEYRVRKAKQDAQQALHRAETSEKRGTAFKLVIVLIVLGVIGAGVAVYFLTRETGGTTAHTPDELADLFAAGKIEINGSAGILPMPARSGGRRGGGGRVAGGGAPGAGGNMSYEDAMNQAVDLGNVENGGGEQTLSANQVAGTMNGNIRKFARCIGVDPSVHSVSMSLAIAGSGQIMGASVSQGSPAFRQCVASAARSIRMPPFSAPRMGASYNFSW